MRTALILILLFVITLPTFAQLTQQDLEKIGNLVDRKLEPVKLDIAEMKGKMATKDNIITVQRELSSKMIVLTTGLLAAWITIIAAIITIPYSLSLWKS